MAPSSGWGHTWPPGAQCARPCPGICQEGRAVSSVTSWRQAIAAHGSPLNLAGLAVGQSSATRGLP